MATVVDVPQRYGAPAGSQAENLPQSLNLVPDRALNASIRILILEDEHTLRESCQSVLVHEGYDVTTCGRSEEARELVQRRTFDIVLMDLYLPKVAGLEMLEFFLQANPEALVIVMTGNPSVESSVSALRAGAWDYLPKPFTASHLQILCGRAAHTVRIARESETEQGANDKKNESTEKLGLIGRSPTLLRAIELARRVAATDASVFLVGESGTGKEMFAQFIHNLSRRSTRTWMAVNCAALPETLLESEMFGHVKGAFTGAIRDKAGLLESTHGGTLFLDELTEMSQTIQAKLLRVLQDGVVRRVGSESVDAIVNVRFIAATNRDPREAMESGILRKDLFYRLSVVPIRIPPLRERPEDIPLLAEHFLSFYWKRHRARGTALPYFSKNAMDDLQQREWRGNVRELQNVIEHAVVLLEPGAQIDPSDLPAGEANVGPTANAAPWKEEWSPDFTFRDGGYHAERDRVLGQFELGYLSWLVERAGANMSKAAKIARVDRTTLYRLMERHRLQRDTVIRTQPNSD